MPAAGVKVKLNSQGDRCVSVYRRTFRINRSNDQRVLIAVFFCLLSVTVKTGIVVSYFQMKSTSVETYV